MREVKEMKEALLYIILGILVVGVSVLSYIMGV